MTTPIMQTQVLGHGHVALIDSMPSIRESSGDTTAPGDLRIVDAARVSIAGEDVKAASEDRKLIRYLLKNRHTTPFEQVRFTFAVKLPIFAARQWIRHRTGCLPGDVEISFQRKNDRKHYPKTMAEVARSFEDPAQRERLRSMRLRCIDDDTGELHVTTVARVWSTGVQKVFAVHLESGRILRATSTHQVLTSQGWRVLCDVSEEDTLYSIQSIPGPLASVEPPCIDPVTEVWRSIVGYEGRYEVSDQGRVRTLVNTRGNPLPEPWIKQQSIGSHGYYVVSLSFSGVSKVHTVHSLVARAFRGVPSPTEEVRHLDGNYFNNGAANLTYGSSAENSEDMIKHGRACRLTIEEDTVVSIESDGEEETWDMEVRGPYHNFIANGVVVHNSFNEMSARYGKLPADFYVPTLERMQKQADKNKQGSDSEVMAGAEQAQKAIADWSETSYSMYEGLLSGGLARELARMVLPLNIYTRWYWTTDLWNLMHFLRLRLHEHAQWEMRQYAEAIVPMAEAVAPYAMEAFHDFILSGEVTR